MDLKLSDITSLCKLFDQIDPTREQDLDNSDSDNEIDIGKFRGKGLVGMVGSSLSLLVQ
jgi:hypothetical protein